MKKPIFAAVAALILTMPASGVSRIEYVNGGELVIAAPEPEARASYYAAHVSILGASNPSRALYINGEEVKTTVNGFFAYYAELEQGDNVFTVVNGENSEVVTVTRKEPEPAVPVETVWYDYVQYASTETDDISRFYEGDDDTKMGTPLARGTVFRLIGEKGDKYIIEDGSYVFRKNVYLLDYDVPKAAVTAFAFSGDEARFDIGVNALYEVSVSDRQAVITLYAADKTVYSVDLNFEPVGYDVDFSDGVMTVAFRKAPETARVALIDAGHGGNDPGALGPPGKFGPAEKDFNLYVSEKTRDYLEQRGVRVIFPRSGDVTFPAAERTPFFGEKPDISVSVHANSVALSADFSKPFGPQMYYTLGISERQAEAFIRHIAAETGNAYVPPIKQNFLMSRYTGCPSMLFEMGYVCNPAEYEKLLNTDYLDKIAVALGESVMAYLGEPESEAVSASAVTTEPLTEAEVSQPAGTEQAAPVSEPPEPPEPAQPEKFSPELTGAAILGVIAAGAALIMLEPKTV